MATIQIKRRTTAGTGPLIGSVGTVKAGEPLIDFNGEHLYIAKADKVASVGTPLATVDYLEIPSTGKVNTQIDAKITAIGLGSASTKNTGTESGNVPVLDASGKLVDSVIPKVAITNTFVVASQTAMLALSTAQEGDVAVRTDINKSFILKTTGYSTLANWQELLSPTDAVQSVNGKTGTVTINLSELGGTAAIDFVDHAQSDVHLSENQKEIIANTNNSHIMTDVGLSYVIMKSAWDALVVPDGLKLFNSLNTNYSPNIVQYYLGIDNTKVLQPSSVIDGGTY